MKKHVKLAVGFCVAASIIGGSSLRVPAAGGDPRDETPIRLTTTETFGPIGSVAAGPLAGGAIALNGRLIRGQAPVWDGDLIEARAGASARALLDSIGEVTLQAGSVVRLATTSARLGDGGRGRILIASLLRGEMAVTLQRPAEAHVQVCGSTVLLSSGAEARFGIRDGGAVVEALSGGLRVDSQPVQQDVVAISHGYGAGASITANTILDISVLAADKDGRGVPNVPIVFTISGTIGSFAGGLTTITVLTNAQGIAVAPLTAGPSSASGSVTATAQGTRLSTTIPVRVKGKFWTAQKKALVAGAAAAGLIGGFWPRDPGPLRQVPPPRLP